MFYSTIFVWILAFSISHWLHFIIRLLYLFDINKNHIHNFFLLRKQWRRVRHKWFESVVQLRSEEQRREQSKLVTAYYDPRPTDNCTYYTRQQTRHQIQTTTIETTQFKYITLINIRYVLYERSGFKIYYFTKIIMPRILNLKNGYYFLISWYHFVR